MSDFSQLLLYVPGIVIFLVGSSQVRSWLSQRRAGARVDGTVFSCDHVVKKDKKDRETFNYYNVVVEFLNPETKHMERQAVKAPSEYAPGQPVRIFRGKNGSETAIMENEEEFIFHPWVMMIGGALMIVLALEENQGKEIPAMVCLSLLLIMGGVNLIIDYVSLKRRRLVTLEAEITDVYTRQISKETKILRGSKFTYYPIVRYKVEGEKENFRRCNINSSDPKSFKVGEKLTLYYDPEKKIVMEKHANPLLLIGGIAVLAIGLLAGVSTLSVLLKR